MNAFLTLTLLIVTPALGLTLRGSRFKGGPKSGVAYITHTNDEHQMAKVAQLQDTFGDRFFVVAPDNVTFPTGPNRVPLDAAPSEPNNTALMRLAVGLYTGGVPKGADAQGKTNYGLLIGRSLVELLKHPELNNMWMLENDVYFNSATDVEKMVKFYENNDADLIPVEKPLSDKEQPQWFTNWMHDGQVWDLKGVVDEGETRYHAFQAVTRVSRKLAEQVLKTGRERQFAFFEAMYPTLAYKHGMRVEPLDHSFGKHLEFRHEGATLGCWQKEEMDRIAKDEPGMLFHPAKWNGTSFLLCPEQPVLL